MAAPEGEGTAGAARAAFCRSAAATGGRDGEGAGAAARWAAGAEGPGASSSSGSRGEVVLGAPRTEVGAPGGGGGTTRGGGGGGWAGLFRALLPFGGSTIFFLGVPSSPPSCCLLPAAASARMSRAGCPSAEQNAAQASRSLGDSCCFRGPRIDVGSGRVRQRARVALEFSLSSSAWWRELSRRFQE